MTAVDGDGIDEDLTRAVSVAMLAAARAGEQIARMTQAAAQERKARAAGNAAEAQRQVDAHTEAAKAYFEVVALPEYLTVATDKQISEVAGQAQAWRERLPEARRASDAASRELGARRPGQVEQRSALLVAEGDAADWRPRATEPTPPSREPEVRVDQPTARRAIGTAEVTQALSAPEAPASARGLAALRGRRRVAPWQGPHTGIER
ncbi:MAG: hypothetical protein U0R23_12460 [Candidatus Nanopelagicales bacterium]